MWKNGLRPIRKERVLGPEQQEEAGRCLPLGNGCGCDRFTQRYVPHRLANEGEPHWKKGRLNDIPHSHQFWNHPGE